MRRSRPRTAGWRASSIPTSARKRAPKTSSRRSTRPTRCCATRRSARPYDQVRAGGYRPGDEVRPPPGGFLAGGRGQPDFDEIFAGGGAGGGFRDFFESVFGAAAAVPVPGRAAPQPGGDTRAKLADPAGIWSTAAAACASASTAAPWRCACRRASSRGRSIRLARQGNGGGDLLLEIEYAAHPRVRGRRPQRDPRAAGGAVGGRAGRDDQRADAGRSGGAARFPPDSEAGRKLRLRGRGLPGGTQGADGDQIVETRRSCAPRAHDDAQRDAYAAMRDAFGDDWRRA